MLLALGLASVCLGSFGLAGLAGAPASALADGEVPVISEVPTGDASGTDQDGGTTDPTTPASPTPAPTLIASRADVAALTPGQQAEIELTFENTGDTAVIGAIASFSPSSGLVLVGNSSTVALPDIEAHGKQTVKVTVSALDGSANAAQSIGVETRFNYMKDGSLAQATATDSVPVPCAANTNAGDGNSGGSTNPSDPDDGNGGDSDTKTEIKVVPVEDVDIGEIKYIDTNYSKLKQDNPDVKGWIYFPGPSSIYGLPINAALVQGDDDYHYLDYNAKGEKDSNGCIYMSAGLDPDLVNNSNTMIYGHAKNPYAFAGLKYLNDAKRWYSDGNNHFIRIKTDNYYSIWQIFSWYESTDGGDFDRLSTDNWAEYFTYLQGLNEIPSLGKFEFKDEDKIISLVTCKGFSDGRVVVHAKLVRYSPVSG